VEKMERLMREAAEMAAELQATEREITIAVHFQPCSLNIRTCNNHF
jgi:hypothetical protein